MEKEIKKETKSQNIQKPIKKPKPKEAKKTIKTKQKKNIIVKQPKPTGIFIQVGAFTKQPSKSLLKKIKQANYKYIVYKMKVKGTFYNKVLIGPYKSRKEALKVINQVRQTLKVVVHIF